MCRVILLLLLWAGLYCPSAAAFGAEGQPPAASSPAMPSCFVFIQVAPDGVLTITERLKGFGPIVERPLSSGARIYGSLAPFVQESDMELVSVKADGKPVTPSVYVNEQDNNRYVRLAARDTSLPVHEYTLTYKARERILFLSDVDRLDWDIWGKRFDKGPVRLSCAISLPKGATVSKQWSRLGNETVGHKPVTQWINKDGVAFFRGEAPIVDREHFVVSVEWNKGVVASDGSEETLSIVKSSLWGLFALLLLLCGGLWFKFGKDPRPRVSIPLFYPPLGPDGKTLSPAAVAYIRDAAMLTSRGFSALLLNLATQKLVDMTGTGSRKDPYVLQTSDEILKRVPADDAGSESKATGEESSQQKRRIWEDLLKAGRGFDLAERLCLRRLFPARPPQPLEVGRKSAWQVAEARAVAYEALASQYRDMWQLNGGLVSMMFILCYGGAILVQGFLWLNFGAADMAAVLAVTCLTLGFTYVVHRWSQYGISIWVRWQEMGVINMILLGIYVLLWPVMLVYDAILDASMADFFLYQFMHSWQAARSLLWLGLTAYLFWLTRDIKAVFLIPLKILGFLLIFFVVGGMVFVANSFMGSGNLAFMGMLLLPMFFMPLMKRPAQKAEKLMAEIEGLALYLGTAEASRLNTFNPPERTPEEFHRFLPYAVALGLEKAWGAQFANSLADLQFRGGSLHMMAQYEHRMQGL
ncbi:DUF2207 family protein [Desulfovibrio sp. SGI.133]|uniref:DUF2207 family protein n=1 Tax=Desulfovibrio sp. SGI.133 TaxID=3420560 RepID=UPI003D050C41